MTDRTVDLDLHRGMAAQKAAEPRRLLAEFEADEWAVRLRQGALEARLSAAPAVSWTPAAQVPRRQTMIANVRDDLQRLMRAEEEGVPL